MGWAAPVTLDAPDPDRVRWLQTVAAACERVLALREGDPTDRSYKQVREDVEELLGRIRAELEGGR
jgi:hypothetical protein